VGRSRTESPPVAVVGTALNASLDASWEIDLFGRVGASQRAAAARVDSSTAQWHEARVSLAAEVAATYLGLRSCEAVLAIYRDDARALTQIAGLTRKKVDAGFDAPASAALSEASAAEAAQRVVAQQAECDVAVKSLVALTGQAEAPLRERLAAARGRLPTPAGFTPDPVPVRVLAQRPDLAAAERDLAAAAAEVGAADADRWPRLSLSGSLGLGQLRTGGQTFDLQPWSIGAGLLAPLIDAGARRAQADAARARYDEARATWQARAVSAVREVEEALVRLDAAARRDADAQRAAAGYAAFFQAAETQWRVGTGSLLDLEQARRSLLASRAALVQVQRDRVGAWLSLYKAVGGGWQPDDPAPVAAAPDARRSPP
jgi:NodT family efflux transporter outer membrane factor (OMF) lipoprotein